ncbi:MULTISPECIES: MDR family oxidoreductase [Vibrio]|jgi:acrylyl-CoA reductase (NADPH)|uniref:MDR family oxidoreductase n=2 Tax=Vibrio TaxID=662 RepID=A0ABW7IE32_9VIBR|nr:MULTISPECIES: MDR family oxidoreductase [Vibrio]ASI89466.1 oxidoreductase [Vibrio mediterranei]KFA99847.1 quinone oxidoreductase [Vibrio sp. ER1A]MCF4176025.1 oxidoreductase [Vibrio sp. McD22-P3]MCG9627125.1 oxidoreductase [Vibrio mediterranei]MCG9656994.1 oxidoreductase [Vibrio mediterranei]|eukprot:TRINITY_DN23017_c0_g2_i1.p1 TRINITY_DN23017_c0_g2~~TRINITY_DN23017_c0_g2_i1.p1  ORF type:complete len:327 (+),score=41.34 TRINITY_DN23017_c0_g2_i1:588-1568(+)
MFKALLLNQEDKKTIATISQVDESQLPEGNVKIDVKYSSLNYKDGLAITGKGKIIRNFPMVPGIDLSGVVSQSDDPRYKEGDEVVLTGWGVGENHWGGMAEKASLNGDWLVPMPAGLDAEKVMAIGTAGFTAMLCVQAIVDAGIKPEDGEVLVTGASGGVGSVSVTLLNQLGYKVAAVTGRASENGELLTSLGASRIVERSELEEPAKPLERQVWAAAVDTVGSKLLAKVLAQMNYNGVVAACGLAGGFDLPTTVMPFILRNVRLQGIDSVMCPREKRIKAWEQLATLLPESYYAQASKTVALEEAIQAAEDITNGAITGRVTIKI